MLLFVPLIPLLFFFSFLFSFAQTGSTGIPPNESKTLGTILPDVLLSDSEGNIFKLHALKGKPLILSLIYTHCASACPLITKSLKETVTFFGEPGKDFNILSLTFDPQDTLDDLREFKERYGLPKGWKVVLVKNRSDLFKLLDAIDFRFATLPGRDFIHPNLIVFIDKKMVIKDYMYGVSFDRLEFMNALRIAKGQKTLPENFRGHILIIGMIGLVTTMAFIVVKLTRKTYERKTAA